MTQALPLIIKTYSRNNSICESCDWNIFSRRCEIHFRVDDAYFYIKWKNFDIVPQAQDRSLRTF